MADDFSPIKINLGDDETILELSEEQSVNSALNKIPNASVRGSDLSGLSAIESEVKE